MIDIQQLRRNMDVVATALSRRNFTLDVEYFEQLEAQRKESDVAKQKLQAKRNAISRKIGDLIKHGTPVDIAKAQFQEDSTQINSQINALNDTADRCQQTLRAWLLTLPNTPLASTPDGDSENDHHIIAEHGTPPTFDFPLLDHVQLGEGMQGMDFARAVKLSGTRYVVLQGELARLQRVLTQWMLQEHIQNGYQEVYVPYIVKSDALVGTGQLPKFSDDLFRLDSPAENYLIPTAEVPLTNLLREQIVLSDSLPRKYVCHSPCFRSEAGSYGRDTHGMLRQHQFEKVELVWHTTAEQGESALEKLTLDAENILQLLDVPYRKVLLCAYDLGFAARKTYDLEVWMPGQEKYREISSCSYCGDFQARRMKARWRSHANAPIEWIHTLNGSALAVGRTLIAVMENYQNKDGSITIPEVLRTAMGSDRLHSIDKVDN